MQSEQLPTNFLRLRAELFVGKIFADDRINCAVNVVEAIIVKRSEHARGQIALYILAIISDFEPRLLDVVDVGVVAQLDEDHRHARARVAFNVIERGRVLKGLLELVGDLQLHLLSGGAGPRGGDNHLADRKFGVFHSPEPLIKKYAANENDSDKIPHEIAVVECNSS